MVASTSLVQRPSTGKESVPVEQAPMDDKRKRPLLVFRKQKEPSISKQVTQKQTKRPAMNTPSNNTTQAQNVVESPASPAISTPQQQPPPDTSSFAQKYPTDENVPEVTENGGMASFKCVFRRKNHSFKKNSHSYCTRARTHRGRQPRNRIVGDIHYDAAAQRVFDEGQSIREQHHGSSLLWSPPPSSSMRSSRTNHQSRDHRQSKSQRFSRRNLQHGLASSSTTKPFFFAQDLTPVAETEEEQPQHRNGGTSSSSSSSSSPGKSTTTGSSVGNPQKPVLDRGHSEAAADRLRRGVSQSSTTGSPGMAPLAARQSWTYGKQGGGAFADEPLSFSSFAKAHGHMQARVDSLEEEADEGDDEPKKYLSATNFRELFLSSNATGLQHACIEVATAAAKEAENNYKRARERTLQLYRLEILLQTRLLEVVLQDRDVMGHQPHPTRIAGIHRRKGRLEALCGEYKRAEIELRSALQVSDDPMRHKSLRLLARLLTRQGLLHDAERALRQAIVWEKQELLKLNDYNERTPSSQFRRRPVSKDRANKELVSTYIELAVTVEQRGDYHEAIAILDYATSLLPSFEHADEQSKSDAQPEGTKTDGYLLSTIYGRMGLTMEKMRGYEEDAIVALTKAYVLCVKMERLPSLKRIQKHLQHYDLDKRKTSEMARLLQRRLISLAGKMADASSASSDSVTKDHVVTYLEDLFSSPVDPTSVQLIDARARAKSQRQETKVDKLPALVESESDEESQKFVDAVSTESQEIVNAVSIENGHSSDGKIPPVKSTIDGDVPGTVEDEGHSIDDARFTSEDESSDGSSYDTPEPASPEFMVDDDEDGFRIDATTFDMKDLLKKEKLAHLDSEKEDPAVDGDLSVASSISSTAGELSFAPALGTYLNHKKTKTSTVSDRSQAGHISKRSKDTVVTDASTAQDSAFEANGATKAPRSNILAHGADAALAMDPDQLPKSPSKASLGDSSLLALGVVSLASMGYFNSEESDVHEDEEFFTKLGSNIDALRKAEREASM